MSSKKLARELMNKLKAYEPRIHAVSKDGLSYYIHFDNLPAELTHKLRVSNHDERERYGYKWQLRTDGLDNIRTRKPYSRYFDNVDSLVESFIKYYNTVNAYHHPTPSAASQRL